MSVSKSVLQPGASTQVELTLSDISEIQVSYQSKYFDFQDSNFSVQPDTVWSRDPPSFQWDTATDVETEIVISSVKTIPRGQYDIRFKIIKMEDNTPTVLASEINIREQTD